MIKLAISIGTLKIGGAEKFVLDLLKNLDYQKFKILLIVLDVESGSILEEEAARLPLKIIYLNKGEGFSLLSIYKTYRILNKFKPDILHGNIGGLIYFLPFLFFRKVKMIYTAHTLAEKEFGSFKRRIIKIFIHKGKIIPVGISLEIQKSLSKAYKIEADKIPLILNGIDLELFSYKRSFPKNIIIGHVGRFERVKNHQVIIETFLMLKRKYHHLKLRLIGDGSLYQFYKEKYQEEVSIEFVGISNNISEELKKISLFFMPSYYEGLPLSVLEAMASGCIIIATEVGGLKDLIKNGVNGYLLKDNNDILGFEKIIDRLLQNVDLMRSISLNNISEVSKYDIKKTAKHYQELYQMEAKNVKRSI